MQIHGPTEIVDDIEVRKYGSGGSVCLAFPADIQLVLQSRADAERLIHAAGKAWDMLPGEPVKPDLAAAEASPANPYGSTPLAGLRDREHYGEDGPAAGVAEGVDHVEFITSSLSTVLAPCQVPGDHGDPGEWGPALPVLCDVATHHEPTGHLPQHTGGTHSCTYDGCTQHGTAVTR